MRWLPLLALVSACAAPPRRAPVETAKLDPPKAVPAVEPEPAEVAGFPLSVSGPARVHPRKRELLAALAVVLPDVVKAFPTGAQRELHFIKIKLTERTSGGPFFHPAEKAIEISDIDATLAVLHEGRPGTFATLLAAGWLMNKYPERVPDVERLYEDAKKKNLATASYGRSALEYYAVFSATWFGRSNVRADRTTLRAEDPEGAAFVARSWPRDELPRRPTAGEADARTVQGFSVLVEKAALGHAETDKALAAIDARLAAIEGLLPAHAMKTVRERAVVVLRWTDDPAANMQLYSHDGMIDILDARAYLSSLTANPWALLHECAHHYMGSVPDLGAKVQNAYAGARAAHLYGGTYAETNATEYFAELSEAYFARNEHFPHTRAELAEYDPNGYRLMVDAWR